MKFYSSQESTWEIPGLESNLGSTIRRFWVTARVTIEKALLIQEQRIFFRWRSSLKVIEGMLVELLSRQVGKAESVCSFAAFGNRADRIG